MKLASLTLQGFKSVKGQERLFVDDRVTILIGANDHGKSNLLEAIRYLNDDTKLRDDDRNWDLPSDDVVKLQWHFKPTPDEMKKLAELAALPTSKKPEPQQSTETVQPSEEPPQGDVQAAQAPAGQTQAETNEERLEASEQASMADVAAPAFAVNDNNEIVYYRDSKDNIIKVLSLPISVSVSYTSEVLALRPRVELFEPPTTNLKDQVSLSQLDDPEFEFMQGIFRIAAIWEKRQALFEETDTNAKLLARASSKLTRELNDKWNQGKDLKWELRHTGTNGDQIKIQIEDPSIEQRFTRPSLRSSGFRTYFLLSMITSARTEKHPGNAFIYLFDEPGTYLHPHAQLDLQRSFEAIAEKTQIVYTTHSLFLVNKNHPDRNRVISKTRNGTRIDQKPFAKNWKSVRESLGILLSNNFLIAEKTLLVEGPSDIIYILDAIKKLKASGNVDIDLNDLSVVDAGDSANYVAMAKLMLSEGREVVALLDGDQPGTKIEATLKKACEQDLKGKKQRLRIRRLQDHKSIEDIFADFDVLKRAITDAAADLITNGIRKGKTGSDPSAEIAKIVPSSNETLGKVIDGATAELFEPAEKISKLLIALKYEDISKPEDAVPPSAVSEVEKIKELLNLRGESSAEAGVFEEV